MYAPSPPQDVADEYRQCHISQRPLVGTRDAPGYQTIQEDIAVIIYQYDIERKIPLAYQPMIEVTHIVGVTQGRCSLMSTLYARSARRRDG